MGSPADREDLIALLAPRAAAATARSLRLRARVVQRSAVLGFGPAGFGRRSPAARVSLRKLLRECRRSPAGRDSQGSSISQRVR